MIRRSLNSLLVALVLGLSFSVTTAAVAQPVSSMDAIEQADFISDRIAVERMGNSQGKPVILIPGMASTSAVWQKLAPALARDFDLHLVNVRGFGEYPAEGNANGLVGAPSAAEVQRYIEEMDLEKPAIIGHSMGGQMALRIAADGKETIGRVMVLDSSPFFPSLIDPGMTRADVEPFARLAYTVVTLLGDEALRSRAPTMGVDLSGAAGNVFNGLGWQGGDRRVLAQSLYEVLSTDLRYRLPEITAPVTVVYGWSEKEGHPRAKVDAAFRHGYLNLRRPARFERMNGAEHMVMIDTPNQLERAVRRFLAD